MENFELQEIWKSMDVQTNQKSKDELNLLLKSKAKQTINKYLVIMGISIAVSIGLLIYLVITSLNRQNDVIYLSINITLGIVSLIALLLGLLAWNKIQNNRFNLSLKDWLFERINMLSKSLTGKFSKLYLFLIPFLYILITVSIHVYFENKSFIEVINTEESVIGLLVATPIGLFVSYFAVRKIRKYQLQNLEFLKDLHQRLLNAE